MEGSLGDVGNCALEGVNNSVSLRSMWILQGYHARFFTCGELFRLHLIELSISASGKVHAVLKELLLSLFLSESCTSALP